MPEPPVRTAWAFETDRRALVLGSSQRDDVVDPGALARGGVSVVRRRSGGGAVLLEPGDAAWLDVIVPRGDERWRDDVVAAPCWLGDVWARALSGLGVAGDVAVHRGRLEASEWGRLVCFAGVGAGEVLVDGRKVVGISQRRTRSAARFQCVAVRAWDPVPLLDLLALDERARARARSDLAEAATGTGLAPAAVLDAVLDELTSG